MGAILLDALGTLVRFEDPAPALRLALAEHHGVEVSLRETEHAVRAEIREYRRLHGAARDDEGLADLRLTCAVALRDALPRRAHALDPADLVPTLVEAFRFVAYPEVPEVLRELRARGHALAVVSNWDVSLHEVLESTRLRGRVDVVVASAELGAQKPDIAPFLHALELLQARPGDALHAGDSLDEDVAGARAAGVAPVLVDRRGTVAPVPIGVPVVATLDGLLALAP